MSFTPRDREIDRINYYGHLGILVSSRQELIPKAYLLEILQVGMPGRQVLALAVAGILELQSGRPCAWPIVFIWLGFPVSVSGNRRGTGTWKFHVLTHILGREDEQLSGCQDFGRKKRTSLFLINKAPGRETVSSFQRTWVGEGNQSLLLSPPLVPSFLCMSSPQVPHAQVPDVQPVCTNEAPLSRIWMAPNHPPGIFVHEGTAAIQHQ